MPKIRDPALWSEEMTFAEAYKQAKRGSEIFLCERKDGEQRKSHRGGVLRISKIDDGQYAARVNEEVPELLPIGVLPDDCYPFYDSWIVRKGRRFYRQGNMDVPYYVHKGSIEKCISMPIGSLLVVDGDNNKLIVIKNKAFLGIGRHPTIHWVKFNEVDLHMNVPVVRIGEEFFTAGNKTPFWKSPDPWVPSTRWWPYAVDHKPAIARYDESTRMVVAAKRPSEFLFNENGGERRDLNVCAANGHLIGREKYSFFCDGNSLKDQYLCDLCHEHFYGFVLCLKDEVRLLVMK